MRSHRSREPLLLASQPAADGSRDRARCDAVRGRLARSRRAAARISIRTSGLTVPRRSLYFRASKEKKMQFLSLFDSANPVECYRRSESIAPQQALAMANSTLTLAQSRVLAKKLTDSLGNVAADEAPQRVRRKRPSSASSAASRPRTNWRPASSSLPSKPPKLADPKSLTAFSAGPAATVPPSADPAAAGAREPGARAAQSQRLCHGSIVSRRGAGFAEIELNEVSNEALNFHASVLCASAPLREISPPAVSCRTRHGLRRAGDGGDAGSRRRACARRMERHRGRSLHAARSRITAPRPSPSSGSSWSAA